MEVKVLYLAWVFHGYYHREVPMRMYPVDLSHPGEPSSFEINKITEASSGKDVTALFYDLETFGLDLLKLEETLCELHEESARSSEADFLEYKYGLEK